MRKANNLIPFIDVFLILLIVALALINPPEDDGIITPRAEMMVNVEWSFELNNDVDTWIMAPDGTLTSFTNRDNGHTVLRRDDLGTETQVINGNNFIIPQNLENIDFMKLIDGDYIINIHMYSMRNNPPTDVQIEIFFMSPFSKVLDRVMTMTATGQEYTVAIITIKDGKILHIDQDSQVKIRNYIR